MNAIGGDVANLKDMPTSYFAREVNMFSVGGGADKRKTPMDLGEIEKLNANEESMLGRGRKLQNYKTEYQLAMETLGD